MGPLSRIRDALFWAFCVGALLCVVLPAAGIIASLLQTSLPALNLSLLLNTTDHFGLRNAILGTALLSAGVLLVAGPIGVGAGIYLAEFAPPRGTSALRFFSEVLAGIPSIVVGYVGYVVLVVGLHWGYSLLAGILVLSVLVLPYVAKTTEVAFRQVPTTLREGARALGLPATTTLGRVLLPPALPTIVTGLTVALAISAGETAPLLYTVGFSDANPTLQLTKQPVGYLTDVVYIQLALPGQQAHQLAYAAAAMSLLLLLLLILAGRAIGWRANRLSTHMHV